MSVYKILRPPLTESFDLPTREELLSLKVNDSVKLIFQVGKELSERMWVTVTDRSDPLLWRGAVDNDATQEATAKALPAGTEVSFHPLDIIQILATEER